MTNFICSSKAKLLVTLFISLLLVCTTAHASWKLNWIDDFNGSSVNWSNWSAQTTASYNDEIQCYTDDEVSPNKNYEVSNGTLKIHARRQDIECEGQNGRKRDWTSGRLNSKDKAEFLYGRIEARLRFLNLEGGTWPAFWMLENRIAEQPIKGDDDSIRWPNPGAGEIDIWEWYGHGGGRFITNFFNVEKCGAEYRYPYPNGAIDVTKFNTHAVEWTADNIKIFYNDTLVIEHDLSSCSQYEEPMFVLLNLAMGGTIGGEVSPNLHHATLEVDYVAHCVASSSSTATVCDASTPR